LNPNAIQWLLPCAAHSLRNRTPPRDQPLHVLLAICDHYEPQYGKPPAAQAADRVHQWTSRYPNLFSKFRDADGRPPQHSFFFPIDEYDPSHVDALATLCRTRASNPAADTFGEIEIHHHHDNDTPTALHDRLLHFVDTFQNKHALLPRHNTTRATKYAFIHGNWALNNSRPDRRWCGVNNEIAVLLDTGCYADFTFPSAPGDTQPKTINSLYYAHGHDHQPKHHNTGTRVGTAPQPENSLMLIQGPLTLNWKRRKHGLLPRLENSCIQGNQPPTLQRLNLWLSARVQVPTRPDWFFVKLHTHGAPESNQKVLLGQPMIDFHQSLAALAAENKNFHVHYVTAREMYNLAKAAEANFQGTVNEARDFEIVMTPATPPRTPPL
jgi:hypothetical protein